MAVILNTCYQRRAVYTFNWLLTGCVNICNIDLISVVETLAEVFEKIRKPRISVRLRARC